MLTCVECHHTDQPAANLKAPLKTSERSVVLTAEVLQAADSKAVKSCRACHLQAGDDSAPMPTVQYPDKPAATKLTNEVAYHLNCNLCHDKAIAARPALKGKVPGSNDCLPCHKPAGAHQRSTKKELATKRHIRHKRHKKISCCELGVDHFSLAVSWE